MVVLKLIGRNYPHPNETFVLEKFLFIAEDLKVKNKVALLCYKIHSPYNRPLT